MPAAHLAAADVSLEDAYRELLVLATRHHGVGTARDIADYYRLHMPTARPIVAELAASGEIEPVEVRGWREPAFMHPEARRPRSITGSALLSRFDSVVWERDRTERLFGFRYRIEIYVPRPQRVHGYYVLPFMLDGELVGRVDLKAHRSDGHLEVRGSFAEPGTDPERVAAAMGADVRSMAEWMDLDSVQVAPNGDLARVLAAAM